MKVAIINPATNEDPFFGSLIAFLQIAADDLDVELEVVECHREEARMREEGRALASRKQRPDYLILNNDLNIATEILPLAATAGIKVLLTTQEVLAADRHLIGEPRKLYPNWLGELLPDDRAIGFLLADTLIEEALARGKRADDGKIHLCGLSANYTPASLFRVRGLQDAVARHPDVVLDETVLADWDRGKAVWWTGELLQRNPETSVIWAANDTMALGACEAIEAAGLVPGQDVFTGGVDWAPFALPCVLDGTFTASIGGHFMDAAWGLVMLYDYHHGRDFQTLKARSHSVAVTSRNVQEYLRFLDPGQWHEIDFSRFSKVRNPELEPYELSPETAFRGTQPAAWPGSRDAGAVRAHGEPRASAASVPIGFPAAAALASA